MKEITDNTFSDTEAQTSLVDFWAPWCGPCIALTPVLEKLEPDYAGKVSFFKLNIDESKEKATELGIRSIPCLVLFKDGQEVSRLVGAKSQDLIRALLNENS